MSTEQYTLRISIIGCGLVGRAWAVTFARAGCDITLFDESEQAMRDSVVFVEQALGRLYELGLTDSMIEPKLNLATSMKDALATANYVQESCFEDVDVKRELFAAMDSLATDPDCILASSSSALIPSSFTENLVGRHRCLVVHPINPPYLVPAVEVVPAPWTTEDVVQRSGDLMRSIGQSPIMMKREIDGFVMNRLQGALLQEAFRLVDQGVASVDDIDIGIRDGLGLRWSFMGPFETIDLNAPDGVGDYIDRFADMYANMALSQKEIVSWQQKDLRDTIVSQRRERLAKSELSDRQRWRDEKLMALRSHQKQQD